MTRVPTAVLISGRGSNMTALLEAAEQPDYPADIRLVLSNRPEAGGLQTAAARGIATAVVSHRGYSDREGFEQAIDTQLRDAGIELVCLAGFMRILSPWFVSRWQDRVLNIHPSLLPAFPGLHTHERSIAAGVRISGCTVHLMTAELDAGPILMQAAVPVLPEDDADSLAARILKQEHKLYPAALALYARDRGEIKDGVWMPLNPAEAPSLSRFQSA